MHFKLSLLIGTLLLASFYSHSQIADIRILGIAQDAGHPQLNCKKACCTESKSTHSVSCISLEIGNDVYLFDATPDITSQWNQVLAAKPSATLRGVFLSHAHIGHYTGLMYLGREAAGSNKTPVYAMPRMTAYLQENGPWSQLVELENIQLHPIENEVATNLTADVSVTPILVPHRDEFSETVGYEIKIGNKIILFIPDIDKWEKWNRNILEEITRVDLALLDATFYDGKELPNRNMSEIPHPFVVESLELMKNLSPADKEKVMFIHLNHTNPLLNQDSEAFQEVENQGFNTAIESMLFVY